MPEPRRNGAPGEDAAIREIQRGLEMLLRLSSSRRVYAGQASAAGVDISQPAYLLLRRVAEDGPLPMGELARRTHMDPGAAARQVARLERDGLVRRYSSPGDGRVNLVKLTARGSTAGQRVAAVRHNHLLDTLADWSAPDRGAFGALLGRFVEEMRGHGFRAPNGDLP